MKNPFMEMIDVKYEFHQVLKALNLKIKIDATPVIDLDLGIASAILEDSTNSKYNVELLSFDMSGFLFSHHNNSYEKLES